MFYSLTGNIIYTGENSFAIECGGVGFKCFSSLSTLAALAGESRATVYTYLSVREDALDLFGFAEQRELDCFKLLIGVSGVGPKAALAILSQLSPDKLALCVASGDVKTITSAQGVGNKIAQRVVIELKDKLAPFAGSFGNADIIGAAAAATLTDASSEALDALVMLGYARSDASVAVGGIDPKLSTEEIIKQALRRL